MTSQYQRRYFRYPCDHLTGWDQALGWWSCPMSVSSKIRWYLFFLLGDLWLIFSNQGVEDNKQHVERGKGYKE